VARQPRIPPVTISREVTRALPDPHVISAVAFGLVSSYHVGDIAGEPRFEVETRDAIRAVARLDPGLLDKLVGEAVSRALESEGLLSRRNPGLYRLADQIRVAARPVTDIKHRLVAVRSTPSIEAVLETADQEVRAGALLTVLERRGASRHDARALLARLLAAELLIPVSRVTVTGEEPAVQAIAALRSVPEGDRPADVVGRAVSALEQAQDLAATAEIVATEIERLGRPSRPETGASDRFHPDGKDGDATRRGQGDAPRDRAARADHAEPARSAPAVVPQAVRAAVRHALGASARST
jgi:Lantibiotic dehydratase, N terminus